MWDVMKAGSLPKLALVVAIPSLLAACAASGGGQASTQPPPAAQQQPPPYYGAPSAPYPPQAYPQQQPSQPQRPPQSPPQQQPGTTVPPPSTAQRPLLPPLVGAAAMQQEVRSVLTELVSALSAQNQALVRGIPLAFDPTEEVNAYAGCDEQGAPFLAATAGILEAVDAMAQTKATDELFGTHTYDAYTNAVLPQLVQSDKARAALPAGIIPANLGPDPRRWSRAREMFDEIVAFTFGHELAHHYLGHTGCAKGQPMGMPPDVAKLGRIASSAIPVFNQPAESAADWWGTMNALDAGRARRPQYEWNESGAITLLDYFARLERAAGGGTGAGLLGFLRGVGMAFISSHPNPLLRIPVVQANARAWHAQHPG